MTDVLIGLCLFAVLLGMVPTLAAFAQFLAVGLHGIWNHYSKCQDFMPRVAFVLPAWNEADVLGASIDSLMSMDYPAGQWRIYVVDDASTDHTPEVMREKMAQYPGSLFHLRRDKGGQGKAHTLNHGLDTFIALRSSVRSQNSISWVVNCSWPDSATKLSHRAATILLRFSMHHQPS